MIVNLLGEGGVCLIVFGDEVGEDEVGRGKNGCYEEQGEKAFEGVGTSVACGHLWFSPKKVGTEAYFPRDCRRAEYVYTKNRSFFRVRLILSRKEVRSKAKLWVSRRKN